MARKEKGQVSFDFSDHSGEQALCSAGLFQKSTSSRRFFGRMFSLHGEFKKQDLL
jgi:hypothetical protein